MLPTGVMHGGQENGSSVASRTCIDVRVSDVSDARTGSPAWQEPDKY